MAMPAMPATTAIEVVEAIGTVKAIKTIAAFPPRIACGGRERLGEEGSEERYGIQVERWR